MENPKSCLVFEAYGSQGCGVIKGLQSDPNVFFPIYGAIRDLTSPQSKSLLQSGVVLIEENLSNPASIERALRISNAAYIFFVTTTDFEESNHSFKEAEEKEYKCIKLFFDVLAKVYEHDGVERHVIFSTADNVEKLCSEATSDTSNFFEETKYDAVIPLIEPLEDGTVVAHYSGKGRGSEYGRSMVKDKSGLVLTLLTLPFLHENFLGFSAPLPDEGGAQWTISSCFGDSEIHMISATDLEFIVPTIFKNKSLYNGKNVRPSAEKISLNEVASIFADIFGKDVIYNPLTSSEMRSISNIPSARPMAQMCEYLSLASTVPLIDYDVEGTDEIMFPRKPQLFGDWLLIHNDNPAFEKLGLSIDGPQIRTVTVFGATGMQGRSVVKGLLADDRKCYMIRAATREPHSNKAKEIEALDPERITLVQADFDDIDSCLKAVKGAEGVFLVTDFFGGANMNAEIEERHARNVIDVCASSNSVKHLVFSTLESVEEMNKRYNLGMKGRSGQSSVFPEFDAKARAAAYARSKRLSCTYVLMPVYAETFFQLLKPETVVTENTNSESKVEQKVILTVPMNDNTKVMCMSVEDLGVAVANIFDSYQVYAGHEIGLVTDIVTVEEAAEIIKDVFQSYSSDPEKFSISQTIETKHIPSEKWLESRGTYQRDLGQMFKFFSNTDAVRSRRSIAKTLELVPSARPLREWIEMNKDSTEFREKLGFR